MVRMVYGQGMVKGSTIVYTCTHTPLISWSFSFLPPSVQFSLMTDRSLGEHEGLFSRDPPPVFFCRRPLWAVDMGRDVHSLMSSKHNCWPQHCPPSNSRSNTQPLDHDSGVFTNKLFHRVFLTSCTWAHFPDGFPYYARTAQAAHSDFVGSRVYACNLPPALFTELPGSFTCHCGNMVWTDSEQESAHKVKRKIFSCHRCLDSNLQAFIRESGSLKSGMSLAPWSLAWVWHHQVALKDGFGEAAMACYLPEPCKFCFLTVAKIGSCGPTRKLILLCTQSLVLCSQ